MYQNAGTGVSLDPSVNPETLPPLGTSQAEAAHSQSRLQACVLQSFQFQFTSHIFARHLHQFHKESFYVRINEYFWVPQSGYPLQDCMASGEAERYSVTRRV